MKPLFIRWDRLPFVGRLFIMAGLALLVAGLAMLLVSTRQDAEDARADLAQELAKEMEILPATLADVAVVGDFAALQATLDRYVARPLIAQARYTDAGGAAVEGLDVPVPREAPAWFMAVLDLQDISARTSVAVGGREYGVVAVTLTMTPMANRVWRNLWQNMGILLLAIALDFIGIWLMLRSGLAPLKRLAAGADALAAGRLDVRLSPEGSPELRHVIDAFNRMAVAVQESEARLRQSEAELRTSEERLQLAINGVNDGIWDWDMRSNQLYLSPKWKQMIGYRDDELENSYATFQAHLHPDDKAKVAEAHDRYINGQAPAFSVEFRFRHKDGSWRWILGRGEALRDASGTPHRMAGSHTDITERKQAEEALRASEERLTLALEGAALGLWDWDIPSGRVEFNERWGRMLGYAPDEIEPRVETWQHLVHPDDWPVILGALEPHLAGTTPSYRVEHRLQHKDGHWIWVLDAGRVTERNAKGEARRAVGIHLDITAAKVAEAHLKEREQHLRTLISSMNDVVFVVDTAGRFSEFHWPAAADYETPESSDYVGRDYAEVFPAAASLAIGDAIAHLMSDGRPCTKEIILNVDGQSRDFSATLSALSDGSEWPKGFLCVARDITDQRETRKRLRLQGSALEAAANGIVITDADAVIEWANPAFCALTGWSIDECIGHKPKELVKSGLQSQAFYDAMWKVILAGETWHGEVVNRKKNGELYHEELTITPVRNDEGKVSHFIAIKQDITRRKAEEAAARAAQRDIQRLLARNELLLNSAGDGIYGTDIHGICTFINPAALKMLGYAMEEVLGRDQHQLFHHRQADGSPYPHADCPIHKTLLDGVPRDVEDVFVRKDDQLFPVHIMVTPMVEDGQRVGVEVVFRDIAKRKAMEAELLRLATTDPLTNVANRRRFMEQLEMELARVRRFGKPATFLMLDIDHFKDVNDGYGHAVGDAVLKHFSALAQERLRRIDLFGRLGGEEFGVLLPGTEMAGAHEFAERLRHQVAETPCMTDKGPVKYTVSIGIADFDPKDPDPDQILARADVALYRAKEGGRNRVEMS
ncbi:PAS domain S-box protein [bacterium]|nr:PAS domain S-box protein [bacterium]